MDLLATKLVAMFLLSGIILFFILLPIKLSNYIESKGEKGKQFLSACNCFGGGVFLGVYMLHMSPEVRRMLEEALLIPRDIDYPVPEIIAGAGFFAILFVEWFIHYLQRRSAEKKATVQHQLAAAAYRGLEEGAGMYTHKPECSAGAIVNGYDITTISNDVKGDITVIEETSVSEAEMMAAQVRSIIMMVALSLDCIFEGMALGLMYSNIDVWNLLVALVGHEFIVSFCLGLELVRTQKRTRGVVISGVFYAITPAVGVAIGIVIFQEPGGGDNYLVNGVLQAIATGVFLYCTFIGILSEEMSDRSKLYKVVMVLLGYLLLAGLAMIPSTEGGPPPPDPTGLNNTFDRTSRN